MPAFPGLDIIDRTMIARISGYFFVNVDDHQRSNCISGRQIADRCAKFVPVGGRIQLGPVLVGGQAVCGCDKAMLGIRKFLALFDISRDVRASGGRLEFGMPEAGPDRYGGIESKS